MDALGCDACVGMGALFCAALADVAVCSWGGSCCRSVCGHRYPIKLPL